MKTRLVALTHRGSATVDPHYSAAMLPWTINDIRSIGIHNKVSYPFTYSSSNLQFLILIKVQHSLYENKYIKVVEVFIELLRVMATGDWHSKIKVTNQE